MPTFQALAVVAVLIAGLAAAVNLAAEEAASDAPLTVNTPVATL